MIEIRETNVYHEWFESLKDKRAKARIDYRPGYRVYFIQHGNILVILLCGGDKSTQAKDIRQAHELAQALDEE